MASSIEAIHSQIAEVVKVTHRAVEKNLKASNLVDVLLKSATAIEGILDLIRTISNL